METVKIPLNSSAPSWTWGRVIGELTSNGLIKLFDANEKEPYGQVGIKTHQNKRYKRYVMGKLDHRHLARVCQSLGLPVVCIDGTAYYETTEVDALVGYLKEK